jgi:hypothetical protein
MNTIFGSLYGALPHRLFHHDAPCFFIAPYGELHHTLPLPHKQWRLTDSATTRARAAADPTHRFEREHYVETRLPNLVPYQLCSTIIKQIIRQNNASQSTLHLHSAVTINSN